MNMADPKRYEFKLAEVTDAIGAKKTSNQVGHSDIFYYSVKVGLIYVVFLRGLSLRLYLNMEIKELKTIHGHTTNKVLVYFCFKKYKKG